MISTKQQEKENLFKNQQLILHLYENRFEMDDNTVNESVTQKGIQKAIGCNISHVSRELKKYQRKGYIKWKMMRTNNGGRTVKSYYLTERGINYLSKINKSLKKDE